MAGGCRRRFVLDLLLFGFSLPASLLFLGLEVSFFRAENVAGFPSFRVIDRDPSWIHPRAPVFSNLRARVPSSRGGVDFLPALRERPAASRKDGNEERRAECIPVEELRPP